MQCKLVNYLFPAFRLSSFNSISYHYGYTCYVYVRAEVTRLKELCSSSQHELAALKDEESKLRRQQESGQSSLAKQLVEVRK